jgi:hypothetical protein
VELNILDVPVPYFIFAVDCAVALLYPIVDTMVAYYRSSKCRVFVLE